MRAVITGWSKDTNELMECYYLKSIPPINLLRELFNIVFCVSEFEDKYQEYTFEVGLKQFVNLEPYLVHKADIYRLGSQDYYLTFEG